MTSSQANKYSKTAEGAMCSDGLSTRYKNNGGGDDASRMVKESFTEEGIPAKGTGVPQPPVGSGEEGHPAEGTAGLRVLSCETAWGRGRDFMCLVRLLDSEVPGPVRSGVWP